MHCLCVYMYIVPIRCTYVINRRARDFPYFFVHFSFAVVRGVFVIIHLASSSRIWGHIMSERLIQ